MKDVTEKFMQKIDQNNMKAMEILKSMIYLQDAEDDEVNHEVLADCALEYLQKNFKMLDSIL